MTADTAAFIGRYMARTVREGTATKAAVKGYSVCGKTGSAETSDDKSVRTDAWFVGLALTTTAIPYAIAVVVEQGEDGRQHGEAAGREGFEKGNFQKYGRDDLINSYNSTRNGLCMGGVWRKIG